LIVRDRAGLGIDEPAGANCGDWPGWRVLRERTATGRRNGNSMQENDKATYRLHRQILAMGAKMPEPA
jgi:hypothetical protein